MSCNQTPVAILQETCVHKKWSPPHYEVTSASGTPNDPVFEITVALHDAGITAVGIGRQKKEAKHDAAKKALAALQVKVPALTDGTTPSRFSVSQEPVNPHKDVGVINAVGELMELCATKRLPEPKYTLIGDEGMAHEKLFTYRCSVSERHETGRARKKQHAKQLAAQAMLNSLKISLQDFLDNIPDVPVYTREPVDNNMVDDSEIFEKYEKLRAECTVLPIVSPGLRFSEYHLAYKEQLSPLVDLLKSPEIAHQTNVVQKLELICARLNRKLSITTSVGKDKRIIVFLSLDTQPTTVQAGQHASIEKAKELAAENVLQFLTAMAE